MTVFIKKQQFNYIKKCLFDLNNAFRNCVDNNIVETTKVIAQDKILAFFDNLSEEEKEILNISKLKDDYDKFIVYAKKYAEYLKDNRLSTSQIRKVYSDIMNANNAMELKRLRPKLAYIQGRNKKVIGIQSFLSILDKGLERLSVDNREDEIKSLKEFAETIVAYRKYYGDKE